MNIYTLNAACSYMNKELIDWLVDGLVSSLIDWLYIYYHSVISTAIAAN